MPIKGYKQTEEHKKKIGESLKGYKQSEEHIRKRIEAIWRKQSVDLNLLLKGLRGDK